jgi:hypothetical protein
MKLIYIMMFEMVQAWILKLDLIRYFQFHHYKEL